jgi:hypothetical protein
MSKKTFLVSFEVVSTHTYKIPECNSPEEAESIAEDYFADGESGDVTDTDIVDVDVIEDTEEDVT